MEQEDDVVCKEMRSANRMKGSWMVGIKGGRVCVCWGEFREEFTIGDLKRGC